MNMALNYPAMDGDDCNAIGLAGYCGPECEKGRSGRCPEGYFDADGELVEQD